MCWLHLVGVSVCHLAFIALFKDINDTEIPITFSKKMILKKSMLSYIPYLGGETCHVKKIQNRWKFSFFLKPEVSSFTHAQLI